MTEIAYQQANGQAPSGPETVDAISEAYGACVPWGPPGAMITPSVASAVLVLLYERHRKIAAALLWEAQTGESLFAKPRAK